MATGNQTWQAPQATVCEVSLSGITASLAARPAARHRDDDLSGPLFSARGARPVTLADVGQREKDIRISSRTRLGIDHDRALHAIRAAAGRVAAPHPARADDPDLTALRAAGPSGPIARAPLIHRKATFETAAKDHEFARLSMRDHWAAGRRGVQQSLHHRAWTGRTPRADGLQVFDLTGPDPWRPAANLSDLQDPRQPRAGPGRLASRRRVPPATESFPMSTETLDPSLPRHGALTRLAHAVLGTAVVVQLASSQVMNPDNGGNAISDIHEFAGLVACAAVLAFRAVVMVRRYGTAPGTLVPWFSGARRAALRQDTRAHLADLAKARLPAHDPQSPLDGAIHGLGLVIVTLMAASGTLHCAVNAGDPDAGGLVGVAMGVHPACASLAWGDLILHAGAAVVDHFATDMSLRDMWRVRCCGAKDCAKTSAERTPS